ncbi:sensor domain-containing protein [[Mycobacterium] nativiensis]|uniref:Sensor domain-containing protein n=1 Tax=[Mycobacterium] nativiensis TaxID=2855503 RepID=A0ABU5Y551_9MYCO|nr:sensor domain-containing protein [Mycolicibacter sp. MYC340]MEB3034085.1 sensor domain-containing protein [Mycolicibacter sp. MYC340]
MNDPRGPIPNPYDPTQFAPMNRPMMPPGPVPPSWPPMPPGPPPQRPNRGLLWALLAAVCVLAVISVVLTVMLVGRGEQDTAKSTAKTSTAATTSAAAPGKAPVPASAIERLLPSKDTMATAVDDDGLGVVRSGDSMDSATVVDAACQGVNFVAAGPVYAGSGWTAVRWQRWYSPADFDAPKLTHGLVLSVVTYPSAEAAGAMYTKQSQAWRGCVGRTANMRVTNTEENASDTFWTVGEVTDSDGLLQTTAISEGGGGWSCQNTLTVRNNVVAQANVCGDSIRAAAARDILSSITKQVDAAA